MTGSRRDTLACMPLFRSRRIVRRAVTALAVAVLLPVWYVLGAASVVYCGQAGWLPRRVNPVVGVYMTPVLWYTDHRLPGAPFLGKVLVSSSEAGKSRRR